MGGYFTGLRGYHGALNSNEAVAVTNNFTSTTTVQIRLASYGFTVRRFTYVIIRKFPYASKEPSRDKGEGDIWCERGIAKLPIQEDLASSIQVRTKAEPPKLGAKRFFQALWTFFRSYLPPHVHTKPHIEREVISETRARKALDLG